MTNAEFRIIQLEQLMRRLKLAMDALEAQVAALGQAQRTGQAAPYSGTGGGGSLFEIPAANAVVIAAGGNATGVTVIQRTGSGTVTISTTATVYNDMQAATVTGKTIICSQNSDGSYTAVSQSC
jgi:hypothetical protein